MGWQKFCKEVVLWKSLEHPNVLPLLCVGIEPLVMISEWMTNGNVIEYIKQNPEADRIALVGFLLLLGAHAHFSASYPTLQEA